MCKVAGGQDGHCGRGDHSRLRPIEEEGARRRTEAMSH